jgi:hypothetical protein
MINKLSQKSIKVLQNAKAEYISDMKCRKDSKEALEMLNILNHMDILISRVDPKNI